MKTKHFHWFYLSSLLLLQLVSPAFVTAQNSLPELEQPANDVISIKQLLATDQLRVKTWLQPADNIVARQQLELNIEISTASFFSGGTRIARFEMNNAIVLRRNKFAVNSSRREAGTTWSVQLWTITIYPQRGGEFVIPSLAINISIADSNGQPIEGQTSTDALTFNATVPESLKTTALNDWVASSQFSVKEHFDRPLDQLKAGDAVRRTISIEAENLAAMMLPSVSSAPQAGLASYQNPARLEDRVNRGNYQAMRFESISYVVEAEGNYTLPELVFSWWNTDSNELQYVRLPSHQLSASASTFATTLDDESVRAHSVWYLLAAISLLITLLVFTFKRNLWSFPEPLRQQWMQQWGKRALSSQERILRQQMLTAHARGDSQQAVVRLYQWLSVASQLASEPCPGALRPLLTGAEHTSLLDAVNQLMNSAYGESQPQGPDKSAFEKLIVQLQADLSGSNISRQTATGVNLSVLNP
ncbi:MAG: hypothetical protein AB8B86_10400 [Pseudomonadales bacterium]